jgi:PmbA protein
MRDVVQGGVVQGYFLSSYSARKLGMRTTGHAGGSQNLRMTSRLTQPGDNLDEMLRKLHRGLFVIELMGQGVNYVTGDYSRGAAGFLGRERPHRASGARDHHRGNMREMFKGMSAVGADAYTLGGKTIGSVLIDRMKIAGS